jgi:hypothetical protein
VLLAPLAFTNSTKRKIEMRSFWNHQNCVLAAVLAVGGSSVLMVAAEGASAPPTRISEVGVLGPSSLAILDELGDGTAEAVVFAMLSPTVSLGVAGWPTSDYEISSYVRPGQSGKVDGYGTAHFVLEGVFAFDLISGMPVGPYDITVDLAMEDATTISASSSQGVIAQFDPLTGETSIVREHRIGNQAYGDTAGSASIYADDGSGTPGLVVDNSGVFGLVGAFTILDVEQIH